MIKRIKPLISCLLLLLVPIFCLIALSEHCYNTFENIYIDKIYTIFQSTPFSQFTSIVNIIGSVFSLFLLPFFIRKIINPDYVFSNIISYISFFVRRNYILVLLFVTFAMFPASLIGGSSLEEALNFSFLNENLFTHIICPLLFFVASHLQPQEKVSLKKSIFIFIPSIIYAFLYTIMVFSVKTWDDFYHFGMIFDILGYFTLPLTLVVLIGFNFLIMLLDNLTLRISQK